MAGRFSGCSQWAKPVKSSDPTAETWETRGEKSLGRVKKYHRDKEGIETSEWRGVDFINSVPAELIIKGKW